MRSIFVVETFDCNSIRSDTTVTSVRTFISARTTVSSVTITVSGAIDVTKTLSPQSLTSLRSSRGEMALLKETVLFTSMMKKYINRSFVVPFSPGCFKLVQERISMD